MILLVLSNLAKTHVKFLVRKKENDVFHTFLVLILEGLKREIGRERAAAVAMAFMAFEAVKADRQRGRGERKN